MKIRCDGLIKESIALSVLFIAGTPAFASAPAQMNQIERGKYLASAGDCVACHSAKGGEPYAGGLSMNTPFGSLTTPNITPDKDTGIGNWTDDQFYRVMHDGIGHDGEFLYPAMPFPWYTKISRADDLAIKAYLFSLKPVHKPREPSHLEFPFNVRESLAAWRAAFFTPGTFKNDNSQSAQINRGAYLVNGPTHCGACHNSRLMVGESKVQKPLQGGSIDSWYAPNITSDVHDGIGEWSNAQLVQYLKTGSTPSKGIALGPMAETVTSLSQLSDDDLQAIAAYLKSTPPVRDVEHASAELAGADNGAQVYLNNCASCHGVKGHGLKGVVPSLAGNGAVLTKGPENVIHAVVGGLEARQRYAPMPAVGAGMSDQDVADAVNYVRKSWGNKAPATASVELVQQTRGNADTLMNSARDQGSCPAITPASLAQAIADPQHGIGDLLSATGDDNLPQQVDTIVAKLKRAPTHASQAEIVNGLTAAYCKVVRADAKADGNQKTLRLGRFSQLIYTRLNSHDQVASVR